MILPIQRLSPDATLPTRGSVHAAGLDLYAATEGRMLPGLRMAFGTRIAVAIPVGHYGRIAPRSGLAVRHGIDVLAGVIDCDYRGEIVVLLQNHGGSPFVVRFGDRIAQLIVQPIAMPLLRLVDALPETERGADGFGSTGA